MLAPLAAQAQQTIESLGLTVTTTPAVVSDYNFRGLSQTRLRPAAQVTVDAENGSGVHVGAFVSNVAFMGTDARQEVDCLGYRFAIGTLTFAASRAVFVGFAGTATAVYNTPGSRADRFGGQEVSDARVIFSLGRPF